MNEFVVVLGRLPHTWSAEEFGDPGNYVLGANLAGYLKVADAMIDQGLV